MLGSIETHKLAVALLLRCNQPARAAAALQVQARVHAQVDQAHGVARCELSAVVALLAADDYDAAVASAERGKLRGDGFGGTDEAGAAMDLLEAYAQQDEAAVAACLKQQVFGFLDSQLVLASRALTLRSVGVPVDKLASARPAAAAAGGGGRLSGVLGGSGGAAAGAAAGLGQGTGDFGEVAPEEDAALGREFASQATVAPHEEELTNDLC